MQYMRARADIAACEAERVRDVAEGEIFVGDKVMEPGFSVGEGNPGEEEEIEGGVGVWGGGDGIGA